MQDVQRQPPGMQLRLSKRRGMAGRARSQRPLRLGALVARDRDLHAVPCRHSGPPTCVTAAAPAASSSSCNRIKGLVDEASSPWHANAAVCALAFIKPVAMGKRYSVNNPQWKCSQCCWLSFGAETWYMSVLILRP